MSATDFFVGVIATGAVVVVAAVIDTYITHPEVKGGNKLLVYAGWCGFEAALFGIGFIVGKTW
jgi:hypothetical protein